MTRPDSGSRSMSGTPLPGSSRARAPRAWHTVWAVIEREFATRVKSRAFILATLLTPVLVVAFFGFIILMELRDQTSVPSLAVVDETGQLYALLAPRLEDIGFEPRPVSGEDADADVLDARLLDGELDGHLRVDGETLASGRATHRSTEGLSRLRRISLAGAVTQAVLEARFGGTRADVADILSGGRIDVQVMSPESAEENEASLVFALAGSLLLYMALLLYGGQIQRAIMEEKSGRIVEVIISSMRPWEFLLGKIVGVGAVGLLQLGVWIGFVMVLALAALPALPVVAAMLPDSFSVAEVLPGLAQIAFFAVCFVLGYLMYASIFAAVGALNSNETEAQQMMWPVILVAMVPMMTLGPVLDDPRGSLAVWLAQVPFFSPVLMFARVAAGAAALWEVALSLVLLVLGVLGMAFVAGKIYRVGILMQGKRPTLPEVWRWVRQP